MAFSYRALLLEVPGVLQDHWLFIFFVFVSNDAAHISAGDIDHLRPHISDKFASYYFCESNFHAVLVFDFIIFALDRNAPAMGATNWSGPYFVKMSVPLTATVQSRFYRIQLDSPGVGRWGFGDVAFFNKTQRVQVSGPFNFTSAWKSAGSGEEWVYVDLGTSCTFDRVVLAWIRRPTGGSIQVSDDTKVWRTVQALPASGDTDDLKLAQPEQGRYVRVLMKQASSADGYILSELQVYGRGGPVPKPRPGPVEQADGRQELAAGAWR